MVYSKATGESVQISQISTNMINPKYYMKLHENKLKCNLKKENRQTIILSIHWFCCIDLVLPEEWNDEFQQTKITKKILSNNRALRGCETNIIIITETRNLSIELHIGLWLDINQTCNSEIKAKGRWQMEVPKVNNELGHNVEHGKKTAKENEFAGQMISCFWNKRYDTKMS